LQQPLVDTPLATYANFTQSTGIQQAVQGRDTIHSFTCQQGDRFAVQARLTLLGDPTASGASANVVVNAGLQMTST